MTEYVVHDNVTGQTIATYDNEDQASWHCAGLNLREGPGGRYSVKQVTR